MNLYELDVFGHKTLLLRLRIITLSSTIRNLATINKKWEKLRLVGQVVLFDNFRFKVDHVLLIQIFT